MIRCALVAISLGVMTLNACTGGISERLARNQVVELAGPEPCDGPGQPCITAGPRPERIADLHADTLLWFRDIWDTQAGHPQGHLDTVRLREAGVDLQVFAIATRTPLPRRVKGEPCASEDTLDTQLLLNIQRPFRPELLGATRARAMYQANKFNRWTSDPRSGLQALLNADDLDTAAQNGKIAALLAVEGLHWIDGPLDAIEQEVDALHDAGVRMAALTHRFTNRLAVGSEDCALVEKAGEDAGLSDAGQMALEALVRRGMIIDLAHASPRTIAMASDVLAALLDDRDSPAPAVVYSHAGAQAVCNTRRNLSDADIRAIVRVGGIIGLGFWREALCWTREETLERVFIRFAETIVATVSAMTDPVLHRHYEARFGRPLDPFRHIALGSDFDGAVLMPFDVTGVPGLLIALQKIQCENLTRLQDLCRSGVAEDTAPVLPLSTAQLDLVAGENVYALFGNAL